MAVEEESDAPAEALLDALGDGPSRSILAACSERPMTAKELTERCGVSPTTVYRRVNRLVDRGLLAKRVSLDAGPNQNTVYEPTFVRADVCLTPDGVDVRTFAGSDEAALLAALVDEASGEVGLSFDDGEVTVSIRPSEELFGALGRVLGEGAE